MDVTSLKNRRGLAAIALLLVAAALWMGLNGRGKRVWENLQDTRLVFSSGTERGGETYGLMNSGPALCLGGGLYTLQWDIETDADNVIAFPQSIARRLRPAKL